MYFGFSVSTMIVYDELSILSLYTNLFFGFILVVGLVCLHKIAADNLSVGEDMPCLQLPTSHIINNVFLS